jgi:deferrochelatase/peroxidase EfeB
MAVGRFEDGTPILGSSGPGQGPRQNNDFRFDGDAKGERCPFHAHIRKVNPRGDLIRGTALTEPAERQRRITRRGITYGARTMRPSPLRAMDGLPSKGVGLLFMCFQADIRRQFAFMQKEWCNDANFPAKATGVDPVVGQRVKEDCPDHRWPNGAGAPLSFRFESFVRMKGGEYFFAPSLPYFDTLVNGG